MSPEPMGWRDYAIGRQLQVELRIGTRLREQKAREEALASKNKSALNRRERHGTG